MLGTDCEDCGPRMPVVNPCDAEPCGTTGFCSEVEAEEPGDPMYECDCVTGWSGFLCDVDIDECLSLPCRNGGACTGMAAENGVGYTCDCSGTGYGGSECTLAPGAAGEQGGSAASDDAAGAGAATPVPPPPAQVGATCEDMHVSCEMLSAASDCFSSMDSEWRLFNCARSCLQCPATLEVGLGVEVVSIGSAGSAVRAAFVQARPPTALPCFDAC